MYKNHNINNQNDLLSIGAELEHPKDVIRKNAPMMAVHRKPQRTTRHRVRRVDHQVLLVPLVQDEHGCLAALVDIHHEDAGDVLHAAQGLHVGTSEAVVVLHVEVVGQLKNLDDKE